MEQFPQQMFDYAFTNPPPEPSASKLTSIDSASTTPPTSIWGTQPPLDPTLLDIQAIAVLTREIFGTDDLTLLLPRVHANVIDLH